MCRSQPLCCDADGITNGMLVCSLLCVPAAAGGGARPGAWAVGARAAVLERCCAGRNCWYF